VVRSATNDGNFVGNVSPERSEERRVGKECRSRVVPHHTAGIGIAGYTLQIAAPGATGDDPYEPNSDKAAADPQLAGGTNSPNPRAMTATRTIQILVMNDAADWFKFQTLGVGTANAITVSFDTTAGDLDLVLYRADGTTVVRSATNDGNFVGNVSPE